MNVKNSDLRAVLPSDELITQCMHCGLCLAVCPTYDITKHERSSPRGRIRMVKSYVESELDLTETFVDEMNFCLDCQACETACPAGVKYGIIVETMRDHISDKSSSHRLYQFIKRFSLNRILASKSLLKLVSKILFQLQKRGALRTFGSSALMNKFIPYLAEYIQLLPEFEGYASEEKLQSHYLSGKEKPLRIAFLTGCLMDTAFPSINIDTVEIFRKLGCEIIIPQGQVCCGSLHAHYGEMKKAKELARKNIEVFSAFEYDYLVSNSAGCGAFMKEYGHVFESDEKVAQKARLFSSKVLDITEFLSLPELHYSLAEWNERVTYHDACHLCHTQKITQQPRDMLQKIPGIEYIPLEESTWCCGSAGIYNIVRYPDSMKFLNRKMEKIAATGADIVVTGNPGCYLQILYGSRKNNMPIEILHPAAIINKLLQVK